MSRIKMKPLVWEKKPHGRKGKWDVYEAITPLGKASVWDLATGEFELYTDFEKGSNLFRVEYFNSLEDAKYAAILQLKELVEKVVEEIEQ